MRRSYLIFPIFINGKKLIRVIVDEHVNKHFDHINDFLILKMINKLDGQYFESISAQNGLNYYVTKIKQEESWYKLVWLLEEGSNYIGIITLFRAKRILE